jgi:hypothetical protein
MESQQNAEIEKKFFDKVWNTIKGHKRYVLIILVLFVFVLRGCSSSIATTEVSATQTYTVVSGDIENSLEVLGTTTITNLQTLVF